jgi:hypothetical protein
MYFKFIYENDNRVKSKGILRQAEVALGVPGRLRPRIFSNFGTTRVVGHQPNPLAAFTPEEIPGTHFQRLSRPQDTWFCWKEPWKKSQVTPPGIVPGTIRLTAQRLNHYSTPGPNSRLLQNRLFYRKHKEHLLRKRNKKINFSFQLQISQVFKKELPVLVLKHITVCPTIF